MTKPRVLLIEPSRVSQHMLSLAVTDAGATGVIVDSIEAGLKELKHGSISLACVANQLPDGDALEFARRAHELPRAAHLPVVMLTSDDPASSLQRALSAGITEVFVRTAWPALATYIAKFVQQRLATLSGRVLVLDDSRTSGYIIASTLRAAGLEVNEFTRADDALAAFRREEFDLVITDVILEGAMSGVGVLRAIRNEPGERARVPVLAVSGTDDTSRRIELLRSGASDFIAKPFVPEELTARVANLVANKKLLGQVQAQQARLEAMAMTDLLTGLNNRHFLAHAAPKAISAAARHGHPLSLLVIDIDHFKRINDTWGHTAGDQVLAEVGNLIRGHCRSEDIAARFGGEEFVVVLPHCPLAEARVKAEKLRVAASELRPVGGIEMRVSVGVAVAGGENTSFEKLFSAADAALYAAKQAGRNRVVVAGQDASAPGAA